jgi:DNA polymerase IV (family X)
VKNKELAQIFNRMADALEFRGENPFKVGAYRKVARRLSDLSEDIEIIAKEGRLCEVPGIGKAISKKIEEYLKTGEMKSYKDTLSIIPNGLLDLIEIQGIGPKTLGLIYSRLNVESMEELENVIRDGSLARLPGMGEKRVSNIQKSIEYFKKSEGRILLGTALPLIDEIINELKKAGVKKVSPAGSFRRMRDTVGDLDILAAGEDGGKVIKIFTELPIVERVLAAGKTKGSVLIKGGIQIDLRVVDESSYGSALQYFTGSKSHNIKLRKIAMKKGLKLNEYGVFRGDEKMAGKIEGEVYAALDLPYIPPELREDGGEIEAAISGKLPKLVEMEDIKGDLHVHSKYSDGTASLKEIALESKKFGYDYVAVCDHSRSAKYARGLSIDLLSERNREIDLLNDKIEGITLLKGTEVDILGDGSLDYPDDLLKELDLVVAAIHQGFEKNVTERMLSAMDDPNVDVIAHPTGRLISGREGYEVDLDKIIKRAKETKTALEINAYPDRLDLNDINCRKAKEGGIKLSIGTDAHSLGMMRYMNLGIGVARRGWLEKEDVLNTSPSDKLRKVMS